MKEQPKVKRIVIKPNIPTKKCWFIDEEGLRCPGKMKQTLLANSWKKYNCDKCGRRDRKRIIPDV